MVFVSWRCRHKTDFLATSALCTVLSTFSESLMNSTFGGSATSNQHNSWCWVLFTLAVSRPFNINIVKRYPVAE